MTTSLYATRVLRFVVALATVGFFSTSVTAQDAATGVIEGRVANAAGGTYLNNARVAVSGTNLQTQTNNDGEYRLTGVPAGDALVTVGFAGFAPQSAKVTVSPGGTARQSFELSLSSAVPSSNETIKLGAYTVEAQRLTGEAIALQEQKSAANIKNVVSVDQFPNVGEGNVGEYLQFVSGVNFLYNPQTPGTVSIRGMPASGTLIMADGAELASSLPTTRSFDFGQAASGNIDRIEITKTPTPDMPANAVGGGINMISKNSFSRKTPLFTYNIYGTFNTFDGIEGPGPWFGQSHGPNNRTKMSRVQPAVDLTYILPVNEKLGFTFALSQSRRYSEWNILRAIWDRVKLFSTSNQDTLVAFREDKTLAQVGVDWKPTANQTFRLNFKHTMQQLAVQQNSIIGNYGANQTGGPTSSQGAATGVGSAQMGYGWNNQYKPLGTISLTHRFTGKKWTFDSNASWSKGAFKAQDEGDGFFGNVSASIPNLIVRSDNLDAMVNREASRVIATDRLGAPVNVYDANNYTLAAATSGFQSISDQVRLFGFNAARDFQIGVPVRLKAGVYYNQHLNEATIVAKTYTFTPPGGATRVGNYDLIDRDFSSREAFTDPQGQPIYANWLSMTKLKDLSRQHPDWFVLNQAAAYQSAATSAKKLRETLSAAYIRGDVRFFENRLWIVGGVRFEKTQDDGFGVKNDPGALYQRDAAGKIVLNAAGQPVFATNDLLQRAQLQFTALGSHSKKEYDGYYPSLNSSYSITDRLIVRAAYARTIGRPELNEIVPGITITDPTAVSTNRTLTIINTGLRPWTANNYDLSLEAYNIKDAVVTVSLFRKELSDFFGQVRSPATPAILAEYGLSSDYLAYDVVTKENKGSATITGFEVGYTQALNFLPSALRGLQVFGNLTSMALEGPNSNDVINFMPRTFNWGVSYIRPRYEVKLSVMNRKWNRVSPAAASATVGPDSYAYYAPQTKIDLSMEYRLSKRLNLVGSVRNLGGDGLRRGTWSPSTPDYAKVDQIQYSGALWSFGVKGSF